MLDETARRSLEQEVYSRMIFCAEALDKLGLDVAGAHLDAALQAFSKTIPGLETRTGSVRRDQV